MMTTGSLYLSSADAEPSKLTESKFDILIVCGVVFIFLSFWALFHNVYSHYSISKESGTALMDFVVRKFNAIKFFDTS